MSDAELTRLERIVTLLTVVAVLTLAAAVGALVWELT